MGKPNTIFQKAYDFFKRKDPQWLVKYTQDLQDMMVALAVQAGKNYLQSLASLIVKVANDKTLTNKEKFAYVYQQATSKNNIAQPLKELKESEVNCLIEGTVALLKKQGSI